MSVYTSGLPAVIILILLLVYDLLTVVIEIEGFIPVQFTELIEGKVIAEVRGYDPDLIIAEEEIGRPGIGKGIDGL